MTPATDQAFASTYLQYIIAAANLRAFNYGLRGKADLAASKEVADSLVVPEFSPKSGVKIQVTKNEPVDNSAAYDPDPNATSTPPPPGYPTP